MDTIGCATVRFTTIRECGLKYRKPLHLQEFRNVQATQIEEPETIGIYFAKDEPSSLQDIVKRGRDESKESVLNSFRKVVGIYSTFDRVW